jgi:sRNA-binding regulator protein Hfq
MSDNKLSVNITLLEGEIFTGTIQWFGRFEIGFLLKDSETTVQIFRHALHRVQAI